MLTLRQVSITFDPFMYVTTNLPVTKKWTGTIYFVPLDPALPRYAVRGRPPRVLSDLSRSRSSFRKRARSSSSRRPSAGL